MSDKAFKFLLFTISLIVIIVILSGCMSSVSTYSVSGYVTYNGSGLSGVTISFSDGLPSVTTNTSGYWSQSGLTGSVVVTPSLSGYTFTPSSTTVTGPNNNVNFTAAPLTTSISITSVVFSGSAGNYTITINGNGFGSLPISLPFSGDTSYLSIVDGAQIGSAEWGYSGDGNILNYQSWSNTQIVVSGFGGNPGDAVRMAIWNPSSGAGVTWGGNVPGGQNNPQITSVSFSGSGQNTQIIIKGSGFGPAPVSMPYTGDLNFFELEDLVTHSSGGGSALWGAGWTRWGLGNDSMTLNYESWSDNEIVINGFSGTYGQNGMVINNGDPVAIMLWNSNDSSYTGPQTAWGGFVTTQNQPTYSVSGYVKNSSGSGLSGVTISFSDGLASVTTNTSGYWSQSGLTGSVVVTPSLSGYTFTPSSTTVTGPNNNVNFTASESTPLSPISNGWEHRGYDLNGTYYYPYQIKSSFSNELNSAWSEITSSGGILTGILANNQMDIVAAGSQNVNVFSDNGTLLWSVNPVQDSGISNGYISAMDIGNINGSRVVGVAVSSGGDSEFNNEPTDVLIYSSNGSLIRSISTPSAWAINDLHFADLNGNGTFQIVVSIASGYALSPRGIYVYDYNTGSLLWNFQTAGIPHVNAIGSFNGSNQKDIVVDTFSPYNGYTVNNMNDWTTYVILLSPSGNMLWNVSLQSGNEDTSSSVIADNEIISFLSCNFGGQNNIYIINPQNGSIENQYNGPYEANASFWIYTIPFANNSGNIYAGLNVSNELYEFDMNLNLLNEVNTNITPNVLIAGSIFNPSSTDILLLSSSGLSVFDQNLNQLCSFNLSNENSLIITDMLNNGINDIIIGGNTLTLLSPVNSQ